MTRFFAFILAVLLAVSSVAIAQEETEKPEAQETGPETVVDMTGKENDVIVDLTKDEKDDATNIDIDTRR